MATKLQEVAGQLRERRTALGTLMEKKTADGRFDWTATERDQAQALNKEADDLGTKFDALYAEDAMEAKNRKQLEQMETVIVPGSFSGRPGTRQFVSGHDGTSLMERKSIGERFLESKSFQERTKRMNGWNLQIPEFETKTLFQTTAGYDPFVTRRPAVALSPQQAPKVVDLLPTSETDQHSIKWMLETTYTNSAATTAEGGTFPESALAYTEQLSPVIKVATFIPVTDEQFEDAPRTRDLLNNRLELQLRQVLDQKLLTGPGGASDLAGLLNITGSQTQAKGSDPVPSAIYKAMVLVQTVGFAEPSGVIMNPADWSNIKLLQTADGLYIWGHPSADTPNRIWGLPVVSTTYMTQGSSIIADFAMHTELIWRRGIEFLVSNSHLDYFTNGKMAIRADLRVAFICTRAKAVCIVTGIPT